MREECACAVTDMPLERGATDAAPESDTPVFLRCPFRPNNQAYISWGLA